MVAGETQTAAPDVKVYLSTDVLPEAATYGWSSFAVILQARKICQPGEESGKVAKATNIPGARLPQDMGESWVRSGHGRGYRASSRAEEDPH